MKRTILALVAVALMAGVVNAGTIAFWAFDDQTNQGGTSGLWRQNPLGTTDAKTDYTRDQGLSATAKLSVWGSASSDGNFGLVATNVNGTSGSASDNFGSFQGNVLNDIRTTPAAGGTLSIVGSGNNNSFFTLIFDEALTGVTLSYATRGTGTGFDTHAVEYSTDGGSTWTALDSHAANKTSTWATHTVNVGEVFANTSGSEMNIIKIKVSGASATGGNNRFDNMLVSGSVVPEPATMCLLALGGLFLRRRSA